MRMKWTALYLVVLLLYGSFCDAQWFLGQSNPDDQQVIHTAEKPLTWTFPPDPTPEVVPDVVDPNEIKHLASATSVSVSCGESIVQIIVQKDMFGIGQLVDPSHLTLGSCGFLTEDRGRDGSAVIIFQSELTGCGSTLSVTDYALIYTFVVRYNPGGVILRVNRASVTVECHYPRIHNVTSAFLKPLWVPFSATKMSEEFLYFTLKLMTDDWRYQRSSFVYVLGTSIRIEASVMQYFHVPLRVFIDRCVVSVQPDPSSQPNYAFIENGCLVDSIHSPSRFLNRVADDKLRFELAALMFQGYENEKLYITCYLTATSINFGVNSERRACSYHQNAWQEASGIHDACNTCNHLGTGNSGWNMGITNAASGSGGTGHTVTSHSGVTTSTGSGAYNIGYHTGTAAHTPSGSVIYTQPHTGTGSHTGSGTISYTRPATGTGSHTGSGTITYSKTPTATGSHTASGTVSYTRPATATGSHTGSGTVSYTRPATATGSHTGSVSVTYPKMPTGTGSHTGSGTVSYTRPATGTGSHTGSGISYTRPATGTGSHTGSVSVTYPKTSTATGSHTGSGTVSYTRPATGTGSHTGSGISYTRPATGTGSHTASGTITYSKTPTGTVSHTVSAGGGPGITLGAVPGNNIPNQPVGTVPQPGPAGVGHNTGYQPAIGIPIGVVPINQPINQPIGTANTAGSASGGHSPGYQPGPGAPSGTFHVNYNQPAGTVNAAGSSTGGHSPGFQPGSGSPSGPFLVKYGAHQPIGTANTAGSATGGYNPGIQPGPNIPVSGPGPVNYIPNLSISTVNNPGPATGYNPGNQPGTRSGASTVTYFSKKLAAGIQNSRARRDVPEEHSTVMQWESQVTLEIRVNQNTDA